MAEVDTLSVLVHWLDYWILCPRLAVATEEQGSVEDALALGKMSAAYGDAAYEAARMRVDAITLDQISKPVAEVYTRSNRMELETVKVMPSGIRMLREFNRATVTTRTKAAANKAANVPANQTVTDSASSGKDRKRSNWKQREESRKDGSSQKRPTRAPQGAKYSDDRPLPWDDFKESITNHFESSRKVEDAHEKLLTVRQEGSVGRHVSAFETQLHIFGDMAEGDKFLYFKGGLRTYIQTHVRVQDPHTLSEAIKIAESADLGAKDHRLSHRNGRYGYPSTNHRTSTSQPGPSSRGPTPMEIGNVEIRKSSTSELSRKY
jgi:hypothetical protein